MDTGHAGHKGHHLFTLKKLQPSCVVATDCLHFFFLFFFFFFLGGGGYFGATWSSLLTVPLPKVLLHLNVPNFCWNAVSKVHDSGFSVDYILQVDGEQNLEFARTDFKAEEMIPQKNKVKCPIKSHEASAHCTEILTHTKETEKYLPFQ